MQQNTPKGRQLELLKVRRSLDELSPAFKPRVELLLERMRLLGFDPMVWEALRSKERAANMSKKGQGRAIKLSMHCYGCAVDIIDALKMWDAEPMFWKVLGLEAAKLGLVWGGTWSDPDRPHVQAVRISMQARVRAAKSQAEIDKIVSAFLGKVTV